jgi:hypothetical protein
MPLEPINRGFSAILESHSSQIGDISLLPICHVTTPGGFNQIIQDMKLIAQEEPDEENIYGKEKLLYFFYGKACYIFKGGALPTFLTNSPSAMIFELETIQSKIHRMLPFDSGGFKRYKIAAGFRREAFTVNSPNTDTIRKYIKLMYGSNENYLNWRATFQPDDETRYCGVFEEIVRIHKSAEDGKAEYGEQGVTIELQFRENAIQLTPKIIVVPFSYYTALDTTGIRKYQDIGIRIEHYCRKNKPYTPMEQFVFLKDKVEEIIEGIAHSDKL